MKKTHYKSIYILDIELLEENKQDDLLMCGSQNWEHYFLENFKEANIDTLLNVDLVEFENDSEFERYINSNQIIDYSREHENLMVLVYGKN